MFVVGIGRISECVLLCILRSLGSWVRTPVYEIEFYSLELVVSGLVVHFAGVSLLGAGKGEDPIYFCFHLRFDIDYAIASYLHCCECTHPYP